MGLHYAGAHVFENLRSVNSVLAMRMEVCAVRLFKSIRVTRFMAAVAE